MTSQDNNKDPQLGMPKWLLYGLIAKVILAVMIVIGVLFYAGVV